MRALSRFATDFFVFTVALQNLNFRHDCMKIARASEIRIRHPLSKSQGSGFRLQGSGFRVQGSGFRDQGGRFRVQGSGFRVQGARFRMQGSEFRVQGSGFGINPSPVSL